jgi:hypothetical protein
MKERNNDQNNEPVFLGDHVFKIIKVFIYDEIRNVIVKYKVQKLMTQILCSTFSKGKRKM